MVSWLHTTRSCYLRPCGVSSAFSSHIPKIDHKETVHHLGHVRLLTWLPHTCLVECRVLILQVHYHRWLAIVPVSPGLRWILVAQSSYDFYPSPTHDGPQSYKQHLLSKATRPCRKNCIMATWSSPFPGYLRCLGHSPYPVCPTFILAIFLYLLTCQRPLLG